MPDTRGATGAALGSTARRWRSWWLKQLHAWHWISAAVSLTTMLLFSVTGITLNHAASISSSPEVRRLEGTIGPEGLRLIRHPTPDLVLPEPVAQSVRRSVALDVAGRPAEWSEDEVYLTMPRPGGDAWVSVDRRTGGVSAEVTDRGWISYLNDLHKGRNAGAAWSLLIDAFAFACIVFTATGLLLLQFHARRRPSTWLIVTLGVAVPLAVAVLLVH